MRIWTLHIVLSVLFSVFLFSCNEDDGAPYPSVRLEFLTAESGADGRLQTVVTDKGERLGVAEDRTGAELLPNSSSRVVSNYEVLSSVGGRKEIRIYALANTVSPVPLPAGEFRNGLKFDPVDMLSIWMGRDYLNMTLSIRAQNARHTFHFIHGGDVEAYAKRAYVSVPLRQYTSDIGESVIIYFSFHTYDGEVQTYQFEYVPSHLTINY